MQYVTIAAWNSYQLGAGNRKIDVWKILLPLRQLTKHGGGCPRGAWMVKIKPTEIVLHSDVITG